MKTNNPQNTLLRRLALAVTAIVTMWSCTYDYFVDESNLRIYIPQIVSQEIDNVLVTVHDASGVLQGSLPLLEAPFGFYATDGIISFKVPIGEGYRVSCFANVDPNSDYNIGSFVESYIGEPKADNDGQMYYAGSDVRMVLLDNITAYPLNYPDSMLVRTANLNDSTEYKAGLYCSFSGLPDNVQYIKASYYTGTHIYFDGIYRRKTDGWVTVDGLYTPTVQDTLKVIPVMPVFASPGVHYADSTIYDSAREKVNLDIYYYDSSMNLIGRTYPIGENDDFDYGTLPDGTPWDGVLQPNQLACFHISGFLAVGISLKPWEGEVTGGYDGGVDTTFPTRTPQQKTSYIEN